MKTILITTVLSILLSPLSVTARTEEPDKTTGEKASDAWDTTKQKTKEVGHAIADTTKKAANAVVETLTPDTDARRVEVTLTGSGIDMPKRVPPGKTAFVVRNTAKEKQNFEIQGEGIDRGFLFSLDPEQTKTLQTNLERGKYRASAIRKNGTEHRFQISLTVK